MDIPPPSFGQIEKSTQRSPEAQNAAFMVQMQLMQRSGFPELKWVERYASAFRELFAHDDAFAALVGAPSKDALDELQHRLDTAVGV